MEMKIKKATDKIVQQVLPKKVLKLTSSFKSTGSHYQSRLMVIDVDSFLNQNLNFTFEDKREEVKDLIRQIDNGLSLKLDCSYALKRLIKADFDEFIVYATEFELQCETLLRKYLNLRYWNN